MSSPRPTSFLAELNNPKHGTELSVSSIHTATSPLPSSPLNTHSHQQITKELRLSPSVSAIDAEYDIEANHGRNNADQPLLGDEDSNSPKLTSKLREKMSPPFVETPRDNKDTHTTAAPTEAPSDTKLTYLKQTLSWGLGFGAVFGLNAMNAYVADCREWMQGIPYQMRPFLAGFSGATMTDLSHRIIIKKDDYSLGIKLLSRAAAAAAVNYTVSGISTAFGSQLYYLDDPGILAARAFVESTLTYASERGLMALYGHFKRSKTNQAVSQTQQDYQAYEEAPSHAKLLTKM